MGCDMKKLPVLIVSMFIAISLCACTSTSTTYVVEQDGTTYGVDTVKSTIFDGVAIVIAVTIFSL